MTLYFLIFGGLIGSRVGEMDGITLHGLHRPRPGDDERDPEQLRQHLLVVLRRQVRPPRRGAAGQPDAELGDPGRLRRRRRAARADGRRDRAGDRDVLHQGAHAASAASRFTTVLLGATIFSLAGFVNAVYAKKFDDIAIVPTFILTPLTYLGGVFYSVKLLPPWAEAMTHANPIFYMVNAFRYGLLGVSDVPLWVAYALMLGFVVALGGAGLVAAQARRRPAQLSSRHARPGARRRRHRRLLRRAPGAVGRGRHLPGARPHARRNCDAHGLAIRSPLGDADIAGRARHRRRACRRSRAERPFDLVLLSCKAYDLDSAIDAIAPGRRSPTPRCCRSSTAFAHYAPLDARFGRERVLGGLCFISAMKGADGEVRHLGRPASITFGEREGDADSERTARVRDAVRAGRHRPRALAAHRPASSGPSSPSSPRWPRAPA